MHIVIENQGGIPHPGTLVSTEVAHQVTTKGGVLLPYDSRLNNNSVHAMGMTRFHRSELIGKTNPTLQGPLIYVDRPAEVFWALKLEPIGDYAIDGSVSIVGSSIQNGDGMIRVHPKGNLRMPLVHSGVLIGSFEINPSQNGFTAFDFYFYNPRGVVPLWGAMTQIPKV